MKLRDKIFGTFSPSWEILEKLERIPKRIPYVILIQDIPPGDFQQKQELNIFIMSLLLRLEIIYL